MEQVLSDSANPAGEFLSQLDLGGGKMLRPAMTLLAGQCCGSLNDAHLELAAMMEMIHLASLLHDDVIDQARTRRKRSSANALWGNTQAVLLGDYVLSKAFAMGAALRLSEATAVLCQTAQAICTGEIRQNLRKGDWKLTEPEYLAIIEAKTASLFGACCSLGAMAGKTEPPLKDSLHKYGTAFGMAFQMIDDLLDILGDAQEEGKTLGADLLNEKLTLPVIHWLQEGGAERQNTLRQCIQSSDRTALCQSIRQSGAVEYTLRRAQDYAHIANTALAPLHDSDAKQSLLGLVSYVISRI